MRYIFVCALSLYVGFASGFIAPAGVPKIMDNTRKDGILENTDKYVRTKNNLSGLDIDETLEEHAIERENIVNARSTIFLNREHVAPMREIYNIKQYEISPKNENYSTQSSLTDLEIARYKEFPYRFSAGNSHHFVNESLNRKHKATGYHLRNKLSNEVLVKSLFDNGLKKMQQNYFRLLLLNPLLIKSKSNKYREIPYEYLTNNNLSKTVIIKQLKHCDKTQNSHQMLLRKNIAQKSVHKFRDVPQLHLLQKGIYGNKRLIFNSENLDFGGQLAVNVIQMRLAANKIREKYLRHNEEAAHSKTDRKNLMKYRNRNNLDCIGKKHNNNKHDCNCHNSREILNREGVKNNEGVVLTELPINHDYVEMKIEPSKNRTIDEELLYMINKLNNTLEL